MSVLRCEICEENRNVLAKIIKDIAQQLGDFATGHCPAFEKLVCKNCNSKAKRIIISTIRISSNEEGDYLLKLESQAPVHPDDAQLIQFATINRIKDQLDKFVLTEDLIFVVKQTGNAYCNMREFTCPVTCVCGHSSFVV
jgi:hypothetical protein